MTYRDDHEAAIERAEALETDLERAEAERDAAVAERDRLAAELATARDTPSTALVPAPPPPAALTRTEVDELVATLARGAVANRGRSWLLLAAGVGLIAIGVATGLAAILATTGGVADLLALADLARTTRARREPVLAAVRDDPERVTRIARHSVSRIAASLIVVETRTGELYLRGDDKLVRLLAQRCPQARVDE